MKAYRAVFPLAAMCRVLGLSPSGYYGWLNRPLSARAGRDTELKVRIMTIWGDSDEPGLFMNLRVEGKVGG